MSNTLYWHDYETFGADPARDRPAQFAGLRTDEALNEVGNPLVIYCRPARDMLPSPDACLITGITPQMAQAKGLGEPEFIARINDELARPATCGVGYNSIRFDDEVTRNCLYRNFYEPYAREYQNRNSRWDLIDLARMTYALRPDGIEWPSNEDGRPSFRLGNLTAANHITHESAHDALSDVRATIGLARLLLDRQPRLYKWLFRLRNKREAEKQLDLSAHKPVIHTSRMYPAEFGCTTLVMPLAHEPGNKSGALVYDLRHAPEPFLGLDVENLRERLFTRTEELPDGVDRLPVKCVRINKCPALAPLKTLDETAAQRIAIDVDSCHRHRKQILANADFVRRVTAAYSGREFGPAEDVDLALYGGFLGDNDKALAADVRAASPQDLTQTHFRFDDERLPELLFRYRARNWPETLSAEETEHWEAFRQHRLLDIEGGGNTTLDVYLNRIAALRDEHKGDARAEQVLDDLEKWGQSLV